VFALLGPGVALMLVPGLAYHAYTSRARSSTTDLEKLAPRYERLLSRITDRPDGHNHLRDHLATVVGLADGRRDFLPYLDEGSLWLQSSCLRHLLDKAAEMSDELRR